jgi:hypothetical protein
MTKNQSPNLTSTMQFRLPVDTQHTAYNKAHVTQESGTVLNQV